MNTNKLPSLASSLLTALDFFISQAVPKFSLKQKTMFFVVGSGNAYNTGKIIFKDSPVVYASESDFLDKLKSYRKLIKNKTITEAVIISASGEKDAVWEIKAAKKQGLKTTLMTCSPNSNGAQEADEVIVYKKIAEPQTYNISTYLGMILSKTKEDVKKIKKFVKLIRLKAGFKNYKAYSFIVPDEYENICPMLEIKKHELFGPNLSIRAFTFGQARHAKFVMPSKNELVISLGKNKYFGLKEHRQEIKMPKNTDSALVMALTYYLIGKIQESKPQYYKKNIAKYCQEAPLAYGKKEPFPIIVE